MLPLMNMHAAQFGTTMQRRVYLTGIEKMTGIKRTFNALLLIHIIFREHRAHEVTLLDANAMLTGQHTANLDTHFKNFGTKIFGGFQLARFIGIIQNQRMQVTVTGMENIGDTKAVLCF